MKKLLVLLILIVSVMAAPAVVFARGMMGGNETVVSKNNGHTAEGEAEGKAFWESLQAKELICENLSDEDFHALGMYFMGLMTGDSHEAMDTMMTQMMGEEAQDQMHITIGKLMSGCESNAAIPQNMMGGGMMGMMNMMTGGGGKSMMGFGGYQGMMSAFGLFSSLFGLVVLIDLILLGIWLWKQIQKK